MDDGTVAARRQAVETDASPVMAGTGTENGAGLVSSELLGQDKTAGQSGGRGIRTHDGCNPIAVFKTAAIGH
jgi:hypothetical protein